MSCVVNNIVMIVKQPSLDRKTSHCTACKGTNRLQGSYQQYSYMSTTYYEQNFQWKVWIQHNIFNMSNPFYMFHMPVQVKSRGIWLFIVFHIVFLIYVSYKYPKAKIKA